jgi:nicotinamide riboside transporter PnuC
MLMWHHLPLVHWSINIFTFLDQFLRKVVLVVNLVHLILVVLIVTMRIIELVHELLGIVSAVLLHLELSHSLSWILHLLVHPLNKALVPHEKTLHSHLLVLLRSVLHRWKTAPT